VSALIADIGGTNARFALIRDNGEITDIETYKAADYPGLVECIEHYLAAVGGHDSPPVRAAIAVAGPVAGDDMFSMTNHPWRFSVSATKEALGLGHFVLVNDFAAISGSIAQLNPQDVYQVGGGTPVSGANIGVIGPGTGLGVSFITPSGPVSCEGGHVTFPAQSPREFAIVEYLLENKYSHISAERLISGKGMVNLYNAIATLDGKDVPDRSPAEISEAALIGHCPVCEEVLDIFCAGLGTVAGNLALTVDARAGVYIAGGIVPRLGEYFKTSRFRERFESKGRFKSYVGEMPSYVITHPYPAFLGLKSLRGCPR